jgi:CRISPR/Cas system-associated exonuclease Cas4 (RecB family)
MTKDDALLSVASLHALVYCEQVFYLEEVERLRIADAAICAGRRLHVEIAQDEDDSVERLEFESGQLGIQGAVDVLRTRSGELIPYEHKRGRSAGSAGAREAWRTSDTGWRKVVEVIERRKDDTWRHSVVGYSLSYGRLIELAVRLLEKEWRGERACSPGSGCADVSRQAPAADLLRYPRVGALARCLQDRERARPSCPVLDLPRAPRRSPGRATSLGVRACVMAAADALLIVDLCPTCSTNVISRNHVDGWQEQISLFRVIGGATPKTMHGPADVEEDETPDREITKKAAAIRSIDN